MDTLMVSWLGNTQMAAVTTANVPVFLLISIVFGVQSGVGILISQYWGTTDLPSISRAIGVALTLPISSAAICAALGLTGMAGGAAVAGCCAQMVGFAIMSFRENRWGGLAAQGLGTSMLQMGNIVRDVYKRQVWKHMI